MHSLFRYSLLLVFLLTVSCSADKITKPLIDLLEDNETEIADLAQDKLDDLCNQAKQAALDSIRERQTSLCAVAALLAENQLDKDCVEEYAKCMAINLGDDLDDLCEAKGIQCGCDLGKDSSSSALGCLITVVQLNSCFTDLLNTANVLHTTVQVTCADKDSLEVFMDLYETSETECIDPLVEKCAILTSGELGWTNNPSLLFEVLY